MSNIYQMFESDTDLEREGITVNYGPVKFLLARAGGRNKAFKDEFKAIEAKYRTQIQHGTLHDDVAEDILIESYAKAVILGWWSRVEDKNGDPVLKKGEEQWVDTIEMKNGDKVKYSIKACKQILRDLPDLFADIQQMSTKAANYRKEEEEADEGNLQKS